MHKEMLEMQTKKLLNEQKVYNKTIFCFYSIKNSLGDFDEL